MRASTGAYYPRLDHVRALAALLVFFWHVVHVGGLPSSEVTGFFPLSLFEEGWTGVAVFMTLSGYLFAKIVDGKDIQYGRFLWNRFVRLAPLLALVLAYYVAFEGFNWLTFLIGLVHWSWPGAAWSLTVELHFYLVFPLLLFVQRRAGLIPLLLILAFAIATRALLWLKYGQVQELAYWTIVGHFDQFLLGMVFFQLSRTKFFARFGTPIALVTLIALMGFWHLFDSWGGFERLGGAYPSPHPLWIILPTIEGACWGAIIAGYENASFKLPRIVDRILARIGEVSYSIYLLHLPLLLLVAGRWIKFPADFPTAALYAFALFVPMVLIANVSYELIERPFLRFRVKYTRATPAREQSLATTQQAPP